MGSPKILTGAGCYVFVNGKPYGQISHVTFHSATPKKAIQGIDQMDVSELAPTTARVQFTLDMYRIKGSAGLRGAGMVGTWSELPREKYFSLIIVDRENDLVVFRVDACSTEDERWNIAAKTMVTGTASFSAVDWSDELSPV